MKASFECGGVEIEVIDKDLYANGEHVARFANRNAPMAFASALDRYGEAAYREGLAEGRKVTKRDIDGRYDDDLR